MNNFKIIRKMNYETETLEKREQVDSVTNRIKEVMNQAGFSEATDTDKTIKYVFSVGGDGTMLHSMHHNISKGATVIGINAGNVGFLTPYNLGDVFKGSLFNFLDENATPRIEKRSILKHKFGKKTGVAVNEYAFTAEAPNEMIEYSIEVEYKGQISRAGHYKANALVISGPCGSTAYNMNAGGAIVDPSMKSIQIMMIATTTFGGRPLLMGKNSTIHIKFKNKAKVFSDGIFVSNISPEDNFSFSISLMKRESNVLVPDDWNFYSVLSKKLHWNNGKEV